MSSSTPNPLSPSPPDTSTLASLLPRLVNSTINTMENSSIVAQNFEAPQTAPHVPRVAYTNVITIHSSSNGDHLPDDSSAASFSCDSMQNTYPTVDSSRSPSQLSNIIHGEDITARSRPNLASSGVEVASSQIASYSTTSDSASDTTPQHLHRHRRALSTSIAKTQHDLPPLDRIDTPRTNQISSNLAPINSSISLQSPGIAAEYVAEDGGGGSSAGVRRVGDICQYHYAEQITTSQTQENVTAALPIVSSSYSPRVIMNSSSGHVDPRYSDNAVYPSVDDFPASYSTTTSASGSGLDRINCKIAAVDTAVKYATGPSDDTTRYVTPPTGDSILANGATEYVTPLRVDSATEYVTSPSDEPHSTHVVVAQPLQSPLHHHHYSNTYKTITISPCVTTHVTTAPISAAPISIEPNHAAPSCTPLAPISAVPIVSTPIHTIPTIKPPINAIPIHTACMPVSTSSAMDSVTYADIVTPSQEYSVPITSTVGIGDRGARVELVDGRRPFSQCVTSRQYEASILSPPLLAVSVAPHPASYSAPQLPHPTPSIVQPQLAPSHPPPHPTPSIVQPQIAPSQPQPSHQQRYPTPLIVQPQIAPSHPFSHPTPSMTQMTLSHPQPHPTSSMAQLSLAQHHPTAHPTPSMSPQLPLAPPLQPMAQAHPPSTQATPPMQAQTLPPSPTSGPTSSHTANRCTGDTEDRRVNLASSPSAPAHIVDNDSGHDIDARTTSHGGGMACEANGGPPTHTQGVQRQQHYQQDVEMTNSRSVNSNQDYSPGGCHSLEQNHMTIDDQSVQNIVSDTIGCEPMEDCNETNPETTDNALDNFSDGEILKLTSSNEIQFYQVTVVDGVKQLLFINLENGGDDIDANYGDNGVFEEPNIVAHPPPPPPPTPSSLSTPLTLPISASNTAENTILRPSIDSSPKKRANGVVIPPFPVMQETVVQVNNLKCKLRVDPISGRLMAYPMELKKTAYNTHKGILKQKNKAKTHKPLLDDEDGDDDIFNPRLHHPLNKLDNCRRSRRKKTTPKSLKEYETSINNDSNPWVECHISSTNQNPELPTVTVSTNKNAAANNSKPEGNSLKAYRQSINSSSTHQMQNFLANLGLPVKRGRGRPSRKKVFPDFNGSPASILIPSNKGSIMMTQIKDSDPTPNNAVILPSTKKPDATPPFVSAPSAPTPAHITSNARVLDTRDPCTSDLLDLQAKPCTPVSGGITVCNSTADISSDLKNNQISESEILDNVQVVEIIESSVMTSDKIYVSSNNPTTLHDVIDATIIEGPSSIISEQVKQTKKFVESLKCEKCNFQGYTESEIQKHLTTVHAEEVTKCKCCHYRCFSNNQLLSHYKLNHPKCICSVCDFTSEFPYVLKRHMWRHEGEGCKCEICGKNYKDMYILKMHKKMLHTPVTTHYICQVCDKTFTRKAHLKRHSRIHDNNKEFECIYCTYRCTERTDLKRHLLKHSDPTLSCQVCQKLFRHQKNLDLHLKRHKSQRDYKCGVCDFYGYTFTDIRKHIERKHSSTIEDNEFSKGSKQYISQPQCQNCGQIFEDSLSFKEHNSLTCQRKPSTSTGVME